MDNRTFYTRLTYEHKSPDDYGPQKIVAEETAWDLGGDDMVEMFHTIMIGATFNEQAFVNSLFSWLDEHHPEELEKYGRGGTDSEE